MKCSKYGAGDLKAKISISRKTTTQDDMGGEVVSWAVIGTPWAAWKPLGGSEAYAAQRLNPRVRVKAVIRFKGDTYGAPFYAPDDKVSYKGREYAIVAVIDPDDGQSWIELYLAEGEPS